MYKVYRMYRGVKVYVQSGCTQEFPEKRAREIAERKLNGRRVYLIERVEG